jgi:hypothetical protein
MTEPKMTEATHDLARTQRVTLRRLISADWTSAVVAMIAVLVMVGVATRIS